MLKNQHNIFNRKKLILHRDKAAKKNYSKNFLSDLTAEYLIDKLSELEIKPKTILELGSLNNNLEYLLEKNNLIDKKLYIHTNISFNSLKNNQGILVNLDDEFLPFNPNSFDLIISNLNLNWVNDLPGTFLQIKNLLKKDGIFLANMYGGDTLLELKKDIQDTELKYHNKTYQRFAPCIDVKTAGSLLQRAGFSAMAVVDSQLLNIEYPSYDILFKDLKASSQTNINFFQHYLSKKVLNELQKKTNITTCFELITLVGKN